MDTIHIKAHTTDNSQIDAIKAFVKSLKIKFELAKEDQSPYNPEFIKRLNKVMKNLLLVGNKNVS